MKRFLATLAFALIAGCAAITQVGLPSPEAQITAGAQACKVATVTTTTLLRDHKITVTAAKSYQNMLVAACESMRDADTDLVACRKRTGSDTKTTPDPCWAGIADVVRIASTNIVDIKKSLDSK